MFLFKKNRRKPKSNRTIKIYYPLSVIFLLIGIITGMLNLNMDIAYILPESSEAIYIFKFSLVKHTVLLLLIFINSFSILGIPLNAGMLVICGYFISVSTSTLFTSSQVDKFSFIINNFPHITLVLFSLFILSSATFEFSHFLLKSRYKSNFWYEFKNLIIKFVLSIIIVASAAVYEAFVP